MDSDDIDHDDLVDQAETVKSAVEGTMYYPVAHGEAHRLINMIEEMVDDDISTSDRSE
ncbi:hypothetical protein [Halovenus sp. HT40]|uniref:hypothetical protein n=1 Tax=Halovenus sp. HT40 TaxID=3126691 RepID=UPI00300E98A1